MSTHTQVIQWETDAHGPYCRVRTLLDEPVWKIRQTRLIQVWLPKVEKEESKFSFVWNVVNGGSVGTRRMGSGGRGCGNSIRLTLQIINNKNPNKVILCLIWLQFISSLNLICWESRMSDYRDYLLLETKIAHYLHWNCKPFAVSYFIA